jgi:uncharacterized protein YqeY
VDIQQQIDADIKSAMLSGDKVKAETLRGIKTALQYEAVSLGVKDRGLDQQQAQKVLAREAKKRADTAEIYNKAGEAERAAKEKAEKALIDAYLPEQASEDDVKAAVEAEIAKLDSPTPADMGKIIGAVRSQLGPSADGALIAKLVKEKLSQ